MENKKKNVIFVIYILIINYFSEINLMKKLILTLIILALCYSFANNTATAQAFTMGVVDVEAIVKELPQAQAADKELIDLSRKYQDTIME